MDYSRWRFTAGLRDDRRYAASHYWLKEERAGEWRVGLTPFAIWLLGDVVECRFTAAPDAPIAAGREIGWVEGLKAANAIESLVTGVFLAGGDGIAADITLLERDPFDAGWLYRARGTPAPDTVDVRGYAALLDAAVDAVKVAREAECGGECEG